MGQINHWPQKYDTSRMSDFDGVPKCRDSDFIRWLYIVVTPKESSFCKARRAVLIASCRDMRVRTPRPGSQDRSGTCVWSLSYLAGFSFRCMCVSVSLPKFLQKLMLLHQSPFLPRHVRFVYQGSPATRPRTYLHEARQEL
jgi:hypothetical protein